ncbi:TetR family transcriptional regulator C-terminal domain-containing protein, partial [Haemophilus parainfluenzae]|uniref:TetR family transcriptional regulator C-terminal domain-containing protein n=1 Tax=Haemophilus parainfluenzae TaxID=729 RepID=UPI00157E3A0F
SAGELRQMIIQELETLQSQEQIRPDFNVETEANVLLALVNGISLDTLIQKQQLSPEQQQEALQHYVDGLQNNKSRAV